MGFGHACAGRLERWHALACQHQVQRCAQAEALERRFGRADGVVGQYGQPHAGAAQPIQRLAGVVFDRAVQHAFAFEAVHHLPQLGGQARIVFGGQLEPLGDGVHARVWRRLGERADLEQARDDGLADTQEVDARVDQRIVQVKDDDGPRGAKRNAGTLQAAQGMRVAPNQWLVQYGVPRPEMVTPAPSSAAETNRPLPM